MADINKFQRSKDRIKEVINFLLNTSVKDEETKVFINNLQQSLQVIDHKMDEFKRKNLINSR